MIYFFIFLLGLIVGSFLNCVIYRLETGGNFLKGRSFCPHCKHLLNWNDLIPVFSFLILKRKCRYCKKPISWQYPLVELGTGLLFIFIVFKFLLPISVFAFLSVVYLLLIVDFLIIIFVFDLKHYIIPDKVIFSAIFVAIIYNLYQLVVGNQQLVVNNSLSALGAALFFLSIVLVSRGKWMGVGDIKLAFLMGLVLGWPGILVSLFLAFFVGAIVGVGLIALKKKGMKSEVPFGPFLIFGMLVVLFFGEKIINWYLNILFY